MIQALAMSARMDFTRTSLELMLAVGRVADGMIVSSRRLLVQLHAGDGEAAALEMEKHLRGLLYRWCLALSSSRATVDEAVA